jgi:acetylglutamate kinase
MEEAIKKADVLIEALPYIRKFHHKTVVIKYGGSILAEERIRRSVLEDIVFLHFMGMRPILVHGGGPNINERLRNCGIKTEFVQGMRVTDENTLRIVEEELDKINNFIVSEIKLHGAGVAALDGRRDKIILAAPKKARINLGRVGEIKKINTAPLLSAQSKRNIVVISPMGQDAYKKAYNVNADEAAASIALSLLAEKFVLLTNVRGIMRNIDDPNSLLSTLTIDEVKELIDSNVVQQGMIPKVNACIRALEGGVKKTHIVDARIPHALLLEIFTDEGIGTEIIR